MLTMSNKKSVVYTTTGEAFMPVRLYYKIYNQHLLIKALRKLKCVVFDDDKRFILAYYKEAKNLPLAVHYQDVPEGLYPITLAEGYIKQNSIMHLDIRSLRRAVYIIDFLVKYIPPTIVKITYFANFNKLILANNNQELQEIMTLDYDQFFTESMIKDIDNKIKIEEMKDVVSQDQNETLDNSKEKWNLLTSYIQEQELDNYPEVERIAVDYDRKSHDDLIKWLTFRAFMKEVIAIERNKGNINYTSIDAIKHLLTQSDINLEDDYDEE